MLSIFGISKTLANGKSLLTNVSFTVGRGEFVSMLGSSGAGKSLTLRCIVGLTKPDCGDVRLTASDGRVFRTTEVSSRGLREARRHIGLMFSGLESGEAALGFGERDDRPARPYEPRAKLPSRLS